MSLSCGSRKGPATYIYAGVNSSPDSISKGTNEHLRTLSIEQPKARSSTSGSKTQSLKIAELSRMSMFTEPDQAAYQRLLRLAGGMGAASTAMGKKQQLAVFEASGSKPKVRGMVDLPREAEDLDIIQTGEGESQVVYCHKHELYVVNVAKEVSEPQLAYTIPQDDSDRPSFRCVRYLTPQFVLAVSNLPRRRGVIIQGIRLPAASAGAPEAKARIGAAARINRPINATALAVTNLTPPTSPGAFLADTQFVVAVAGNDSSLSLFTLEHRVSDGLTLLADLYPLHTVKETHGGGNITGLSFSTFSTPKTHLRPQFIKLASTSLQRSVAVHTIPLRRHAENRQRSPKAPPPPVRYIVAMKSKAPSSIPLMMTFAVVILIMAVLGQASMEMMGRSPPIVHVHRVLPSWYKVPEQPRQPIQNEFAAGILGGGEKVVVSSGEEDQVRVDVHSDEMLGDMTSWEDLAEEQKEVWREKLAEAGTWTKDMGEGVLKGVLFRELAGAVGDAVDGQGV